MTFDEFQNDEKTIFALIRAIEVIGEATKQIPIPLREKYPDILADLSVITEKFEVMNQDMKTTKDELGQLGKRQQWQDVAMEQTQR
jgi:uncharacterized protein with HEPN domain